jgi:nitronate monooxygenase
MTFDTALTRLLGIQHPILLAPMGGVAGGALARAVTEAGGLGLIGVGYDSIEHIDAAFREADGARVGIGFISWHLAQSPERLSFALARKPALIQLSFGDAAPFVEPIKAAGVKLAIQIQTLHDARRAADLGADIVIAQGGEAGGHGASRGLFPLLPAVVDAVAPLPVVAAGGIADGRGLIAALALGASGVLVGTRFAAARESRASANAKAKLLAASGDATVRTRVFDIVRGIDWPAPYTGRALENQFTHTWHGREDALVEALAHEAPRYAEATARGDLDTALVWAGEGVDMITDVPPAGELVARMVREALDAQARVSSYLRA